ncbi:hypothetical protein BDP27DRAFT_1330959 [Rhodocollybia butyracea]|uniref:F-box domain-containing protein n=1 Tax=Rhodocollybia butyracea TaxID=206335 RepID=A0A9P5PN76_9AGAR|nr:hypothetical protein BDP27DRAFT_1330959 [Rhodocollybia butyracea]
MPLSQAAEYYLGLTQIEGPVDLQQSDISALQTLLSELEVLPAHTHYSDHISNSVSPEIAAKIDGSIQPLSTAIIMLRNILSPIRHIPLEILSLIFEVVCLTEYIDYDPEYILAVGGVCKAWRNALYATPRVWSRLYLDICSHRRVLLDDDAPSVEQWLTRSLGMPLGIELVFVTQDNDSRSYLQKLWRPMGDNVALMYKAKCVTYAVGGFSQQIRSFKITVSPEMFHLLTCFNELEFPLLETISLTIAPKLRDVRVVEPVNAFRPVLDDFHAPLAQLTSLSLDLRKMKGRYESPPPALNGFVELLSKCENLITLKILIGRIHAAFGSMLTLSPPVHLPYLRSLDLSYHAVTWPTSDRDSLLKYITAPKLEHLILRCNVPLYYIVDGSNLVDFQTRSSISLQSLKLINFSIPDHEELANRVISILAACPSVHSFEMKLKGDVRLITLIQAMTYTKGQPVILPYITHLSLGASKSEYGLDLECPSSELVHMILSRIQGAEETDGVVVSRLQKVVLTDIVRTEAFREIYNIPDLDVHV